ncbi:hypothetical protein [Pseudogemmobacter sonorensis]|uniref:hypothetical protein n=1 Tax=Pseudogemmobacter sonorensis TaxID=2989681 RepID=UPI003674A0B6
MFAAASGTLFARPGHRRPGLMRPAPVAAPVAAPAPAAMPGSNGTCVVRLIDRRTGLTHRVNGSPLVVFTRNPAEAMAELLEGRDRGAWEVRVDAIEP